MAGSGAGLSLFRDPELELRLGGGRLSGEAWPGPMTMAESADGETVRTLSDAAVRGLALAGVEAAEAHALLLGRADLADAPGVSHQALLAAGLHRPRDRRGGGRPAPGLPPRRRLRPLRHWRRLPARRDGRQRRAAGRPAVRRPRAQWGSPPPTSPPPRPTRSAADSLAQAEFLTPIARDIFRTREALGEAPRQAMVQALETALAIPSVIEAEVAWDASPGEVLAVLDQAAGPIRVRRAAAPADLTLDLPLLGEPRSARAPEPPEPSGERIVERVVERDRTRRKLHRTAERATSRKPRSAAIRSICTPANTTTASLGEIFIEHAQGRRRLPLADEQFRDRDLHRPSIWGAAGGVRRRLRLHALRAGGAGDRQRHGEIGHLDPGLHLPRAGRVLPGPRRPLQRRRRAN